MGLNSQIMYEALLCNRCIIRKIEIELVFSICEFITVFQMLLQHRLKMRMEALKVIKTKINRSRSYSSNI